MRLSTIKLSSRVDPHCSDTAGLGLHMICADDFDVTFLLNALIFPLLVFACLAVWKQWRALRETWQRERAVTN